MAKSPLPLFIGGAAIALCLIWPLMGTAQDKSDKAKDLDPHAQHKYQPSADDRVMSGQMEESAWWFDNYSRRLKQEMAGREMAQGESGMDGLKEMITDKIDAGSMAEASSLSGMGKMQMASSMPGSPGVSHVYHIGATGFFLNHPEHITLSTQQQEALNRMKQDALLNKSMTQRQIDEAEQELWALTGADEPDVSQIEAKVQTIEKLRSEQRMAFIQSVAEAAKLLTAEQRQVLLGIADPDTSQPNVPVDK